MPALLSPCIELDVVLLSECICYLALHLQFTLQAQSVELVQLPWPESLDSAKAIPSVSHQALGASASGKSFHSATKSA